MKLHLIKKSGERHLTNFPVTEARIDHRGLCIWMADPEAHETLRQALLKNDEDCDSSESWPMILNPKNVTIILKPSIL